ncbi:phosphotransferase [Virgibacillus proomii]|uniref:phosphotransferase n=1 Tax=Virgibacillus proomii TaxID=84407 RepID=UPI00359F7529
MLNEVKLCHGNYHLFNLILANDHVTIIDWVDVSEGNGCADVYQSFSLYRQHSLEFVEKYLFYYVRLAVCPDRYFLVGLPLLRVFKKMNSGFWRLCRPLYLIFLVTGRG